MRAIEDILAFVQTALFKLDRFAPELGERSLFSLAIFAGVFGAIWILPTFLLVCAIMVLMLLMIRELAFLYRKRMPFVPTMLIVFSALSLILIATEDGVGHVLLTYLFLIIMINDTAAYLFGARYGRTPLHPRISPKKTREGALCGVASAMLAGVLFSLWAGTGFFTGLVSALILAVAGTLGDLYESSLKRHVGVKDSGRSLGAHGGFLDRFDSMLFAAPTLALPLLLLRLFS